MLGKLLTADANKTEVLNTFFASVFTSISQAFVPGDRLKHERNYG